MLPELSQEEDVMVQSVTFRPDGLLEITYSESRERSNYASIIRTMLVERRLFEEDVRNLESDIRDLIDEGYVLLRNPPTTLGEHERDKNRDQD